MSTTLLDEPATRPATNSADPAQRLRTTMAAVRVAFTWFGTRKTLTPAQKSEAADTFGAEGDFLSAGKKLIDTRHPAFKEVTAVRGRIVNFWKGLSLPYPEPAIRLIRQDDVGTFNVQLTTLKSELEESVWRLDEHFAELKAAARQRLGRLFNSETRLSRFATRAVRGVVGFSERRAAGLPAAAQSRTLSPGKPARVGQIRRSDPTS